MSNNQRVHSHTNGATHGSVPCIPIAEMRARSDLITNHLLELYQQLQVNSREGSLRLPRPVTMEEVTFSISILVANMIFEEPLDWSNPSERDRVEVRLYEILFGPPERQQS